MTNLKLAAEARNDQGRGASRRLRRAGRVPAIVYGGNQQPVTITVDHNTIFHALKKEEFHTSILDLEVNGKSEKVVLRDFHMHSFRLEVLHLDLQRVTEKEELRMLLPLHFLNEDACPAVKTQGAHITHVTTEVEVRALAKDLPHFIEVDLIGLNAGQAVHLSDLVLPKGVTLEKLLRGDDAAVVIAASIAEVEEVEIVSPADVPAEKGEKSTTATDE